ncbi:MAG: 4Fe-4S binding protein [Bacteriovoracaceae bacterium]|nr:4Fe-4S binding protein [Bacteriovoracaceae bacterium]
MKIALEVNTRCINCDVCRVICPEDSVTLFNGQYLIDNWSCTLCGLCVELCPTDAIKVLETESF